MKLSLLKDLDPLRLAARAAIDAAAGDARRPYITVTTGQEMVYLEKRREAEALIAAPATSPAELPHLAAESAASGASLTETAIVILTLAHQWSGISAQIDAVRLTAKTDLDAAVSPAAIEAIVTGARQSLATLGSF